MRWVILIAGLLGGVGVAIGAYAAHGLEKSLQEQMLAPEDVIERLDQCDVAVRYHMIHVLALLAIGLGCGQRPSRRSHCAVVLFLLGIALFSGGLYSMVFIGQMGHWAIVPSGGLCFILAWLCTASLGWKAAPDA
jgi:uncharacterized membrane protein YgdD (TMEM256/DUF423 family)